MGNGFFEECLFKCEDRRNWWNEKLYIFFLGLEGVVFEKLRKYCEDLSN